MMVGSNKGSDEAWKLVPEGSVGIELGVWRGDSSEKFLRRASVLYMVDAWRVAPYRETAEHGSFDAYLARYSDMVGSSDPADFQKYYDNVYRGVLERFQNTSGALILRESTDEFFERHCVEVDWIYVDASHDCTQVLRDLENSLKGVKEGGFIMGDDYPNKDGVRSAVDKFCSDHALKAELFGVHQWKVSLPSITS